MMKCDMAFGFPLFTRQFNVDYSFFIDEKFKIALRDFFLWEKHLACDFPLFMVIRKKVKIPFELTYYLKNFFCYTIAVFYTT